MGSNAFCWLFDPCVTHFIALLMKCMKWIWPRLLFESILGSDCKYIATRNKRIHHSVLSPTVLSRLCWEQLWPVTNSYRGCFDLTAVNNLLNTVKKCSWICLFIWTQSGILWPRPVICDLEPGYCPDITQLGLCTLPITCMYMNKGVFGSSTM